jgi:hypothetical protein
MLLPPDLLALKEDGSWFYENNEEDEEFQVKVSHGRRIIWRYSTPGNQQAHQDSGLNNLSLRK